MHHSNPQCCLSRRNGLPFLWSHPGLNVYLCHKGLESHPARTRRSPKCKGCSAPLLGRAHFQGKCKSLQASWGNNCLTHSRERERGLEKYYYKFLASITTFVSSGGGTPSRTAQRFQWCVNVETVTRRVFFSAGHPGRIP